MPLNDCLSLYPAQALNRQELNAGWRMAIATLGEGEDRGFPRLDFDDDAWVPVQVPRLHGAILAAFGFRHVERNELKRYFTKPFKALPQKCCLTVGAPLLTSHF